MYRKLVISMVSILGFMTLVVSAQQPNSSSTGNGFPADLQGPGVEQGAVPAYGNYFTTLAPNGMRTREEHSLARQSDDLVKQLGKAEGDDKDKIKTKLTQTLDKLFDVRQKRHEAELKALEDQVKKLKEMVQKRKDNRREIIGRRLEQLVREAEGLGW